MRKSDSKRTRSWVFGALWLALAAGLLGGCATTTYQARKAEPSGFLGDYAQLRPGQGDAALLVYVNPRANFKAYNMIMLDPVRIYAAQGSALAKAPKEDLQRLVNYFDATLREHLQADYTFVNTSGPGVLRLRVAITEAKGSKVVLDTISTLVPMSLAVSEVKNLATGSHSAVGAAGAECEALDSASNERLFAAVDARVGRKVTGKFDKFNPWHTVEDAFGYWASRMQTRLRELRNKGSR